MSPVGTTDIRQAVKRSATPADRRNENQPQPRRGDRIKTQ